MNWRHNPPQEEETDNIFYECSVCDHIRQQPPLLFSDEKLLKNHLLLTHKKETIIDYIIEDHSYQTEVTEQDIKECNYKIINNEKDWNEHHINRLPTEDYETKRYKFNHNADLNAETMNLFDRLNKTIYEEDHPVSNGEMIRALSMICGRILYITMKNNKDLTMEDLKRVFIREVDITIKSISTREELK